MAKIFFDSASLTEIEEVLKIGFVSGLTTNPTFLKAEAHNEALFHLQKIVSILNRNERKLPFCVQVMTNDTEQMIKQAELLVEELKYEQLVIKITCGWKELQVIKTLTQNGIQVNCTACITPAQIALVSNSGAKYISLFLGKARDSGENTETLIQRCMKAISETEIKSELIVGSLRTVADVELAILADADIVTVRTEILKDMIKHSKTKEAIDAFTKDFLPLQK